jgi:hypothetical protein
MLLHSNLQQHLRIHLKYAEELYRLKRAVCFWLENKRTLQKKGNNQGHFCKNVTPISMLWTVLDGW